jgi:hypothetical protein
MASSMTNDRLVQEALKLLIEHGPRGPMERSHAIAKVAEFPPFNSMDDEDLEPIVDAALSQRVVTERRDPPRDGGKAGRLSGGPKSFRPAPSEELIKAPFRFVTIDDRVVLTQPETKLASWGFPIAGGFSGEIEVEWAFETPMLIGVEANEIASPMKIDGKYVIPGATLRGAMRAAMGIVCRSRLTQVNTNHKYGVRDFTHPLFKEGQGKGAQRLAWDKLGAGWLQKKEASADERARGLSDYVLTPCDKGIVRIRALPTTFNGNNPTASGEWHRAWLQLKLAERYQKAGYATPAGIGRNAGNKVIIDFDSSNPTKFVKDPQAGPADPTSNDHFILGAGGRSGWFVFSSKSPSLANISPQTLNDQESSRAPGNQKKREYVFFERLNAKEVRLDSHVFEQFVRINSKPGKTSPKPDGSYGVMEPTLAAGKRIPVFYAGDPDHQDDGLDLGLTRLFKLPHLNSVGDVLKRQKAHDPAPGNPDMVEALFGHVFDRVDLGIAGDRLAPGDVARKSRIAFGFARLTDGVTASETAPITTVATAPRASYGPFYLRGPIKDWTDEALNGRKDDARLAGRKRYFPRFPASDKAAAADRIRATLSERSKQQNRDMESKLKFLQASSKELTFGGPIRLHNVTAVEIGALLWTLTHGGASAKPYRHMIGRAKNAGAGQARVKSIKLMLTAHPGLKSQAELLTNPEAWESKGVDGGWVKPAGQSLGPFLRAFETYMKRHDTVWPNVDDIREFLGVSDPQKGAELPADFLPTPNDFGTLRKSVKAGGNQDPAPVTRATDRLLRTPSVTNVDRPYA